MSMNFEIERNEELETLLNYYHENKKYVNHYIELSNLLYKFTNI